MMTQTIDFFFVEALFTRREKPARKTRMYRKPPECALQRPELLDEDDEGDEYEEDEEEKLGPYQPVLPTTSILASLSSAALAQGPSPAAA